MKRFLRITIAGILVLFSSSAMAQQLKFGYVNSQEILFLMPEIDSIQVKITKLNEDYSEILETMQVEFNQKYQDFQKNLSTYSPAVRQTKEQELQGLQQRLEEFYSNANQEIEQTRNELFAPVMEKAQNAIQKVGRDNGYTAVFDRAAGALIYIDEKNPAMVDISQLVKNELGIKDKN